MDAFFYIVKSTKKLWNPKHRHGSSGNDSTCFLEHKISSQGFHDITLCKMKHFYCEEYWDSFEMINYLFLISRCDTRCKLIKSLIDPKMNFFFQFSFFSSLELVLGLGLSFDGKERLSPSQKMEKFQSNWSSIIGVKREVEKDDLRHSFTPLQTTLSPPQSRPQPPPKIKRAYF